MQIVIDIPEMQNKMVDALMELPPQVENNLISAIRHGKPLDSVLDEIRAEIEKLDGMYVIGDYGIYGENAPKYIRIKEVIDIIDKYKAEKEVSDADSD